MAPPRDRTLWRDPDFMKLWVGQTISLVGSHFTGLAMQFIAVLTLGATPAQIGLLAAVNSSPVLLVGLFAGVWVDRHPRRPILIAADVGRALLLATIPAAALTGRLAMEQVYVVSFLTGTLGAFFDVAYQAYLPTLVRSSQLVEGNSKLATSRSAANIAGLSLAGVVIQAITAPLAIAADALSYLASALCLVLIRREDTRPAVLRAPLLTQVQEGMSVVFGDPLLRAFAGCTTTSNALTAPFFTLYILFGTSELGLRPATLGLIYGVGIIGGLIGAQLAGPAAVRWGVGRAILLAAFVGALEVLPAVFATPSTAVVLLLVSSVVGNFGWTIYDVTASSVRQVTVPPSLQGRMNATLSFVTTGVLPIGGLIGGALGELIGVRATIALAACGSLLSVLWIVFSPTRDLKQLPEVVAE